MRLTDFNRARRRAAAAGSTPDAPRVIARAPIRIRGKGRALVLQTRRRTLPEQRTGSASSIRSYFKIHFMIYFKVSIAFNLIKSTCHIYSEILMSRLSLSLEFFKSNHIAPPSLYSIYYEYVILDICWISFIWLYTQKSILLLKLSFLIFFL